MAKGLPSLPTDALSIIRVSIEIDRTEIAQFSEVSGLASEVDVIELEENTPDGKLVHHKAPGAVKPATLTLRRAEELVQGALGLARGGQSGQARRRAAKRSGRDEVVEQTRRLRRYSRDAWVSKISAGTLKAGATEVLAVEVSIVTVDRAGLTTDARCVDLNGPAGECRDQRGLRLRVPVPAAARLRQARAARSIAKA